MDELLKQLDKLETEEFMLKMTDTWDDGDYRHSWELQKQIQKIKQQLKDEYNWKGENE